MSDGTETPTARRTVGEPGVSQINKTKWTLEEVYRGTRFDQLIPLPEISLGEELMNQCKALHDEWVLRSAGGFIPKEAFTIPKWIFLEYLVKHQNLLLHGSAKRIGLFEPRSSDDNIVDGHRPRVYAASSGIMATFFGILDRPALAKHGISAMNVFYAPYKDATGESREGFHFAIDYRCLRFRPYQKGVVHVLSRDAFTSDYMGIQWYSEVPVAPRVMVEMEPEDFPLLNEVRGIDWEYLAKNVPNTMKGFPWMENKSLYPIIGMREAR